MLNAAQQNIATPTIDGEAEALVEQIGLSTDPSALNTVAACLQLPKVDSLSALESFLDQYREKLLIPVELPAILGAWNHTRQFQVRELIALDRGLEKSWALPEFAAASQRVGRMRLKAMRPMKDHRLVQRYWDAVEAKQAHAWHLVVYGVMLGTYSLPLRQGLLCYAGQTLGGFISAAGRNLEIPEDTQTSLFVQTEHRLHLAVEKLLPAGPVVC